MIRHDTNRFTYRHPAHAWLFTLTTCFVGGLWSIASRRNCGVQRMGAFTQCEQLSRCNG